MSATWNEGELSVLEMLLRRRFLTASQIAKATDCSKPTAYSRVGELERRGLNVIVRRVRTGTTGPEAKAFGIGARARMDTIGISNGDGKRFIKKLDKFGITSKREIRRLTKLVFR